MIDSQAMGGTPVRVTDGASLFEVVRPWAKLPPGREFGPVSQVAVGTDGLVYVVQRTSPAVLVFGPDGALQAEWHHRQLGSVHGICAAPDGTLLVTSFDGHQVLRFDGEGRLLQEFGTLDGPRWNEPFNHPTDVAVAPDGEVYVADGYGNARVHRFAPDGRHLASWGSPGIAPGQFQCPHGIWITGRDEVVILDRDNSRCQIFDRQGRLSAVWSGFTKPMDVWGHPNGDLYVTDQTPRILRLSPEGRVVGAMRGFTVFPHGIWGDARGDLFVAEQLPSGIAKYRRVD